MGDEDGGGVGCNQLGQRIGFSGILSSIQFSLDGGTIFVLLWTGVF